MPAIGWLCLRLWQLATRAAEWARSRGTLALLEGGVGIAFTPGNEGMGDVLKFLNTMIRGERTAVFAWAWVLTLALVTPTWAAPLGDEAVSASDDTRAHMVSLVDSLKILLPLTTSDERFGSPISQPVVRDGLVKLAQRAGDLEAHGRDKDASFAFLSRTLALDARRALNLYENGEVRTARFVVQSSVETCVTCHSRLPGERESRFGAELLSNLDLDELHWQERARLQTATRRYDAALATYETGLQSEEATASDVMLAGVFEEYLELCIRAERDPARADATLVRFRRRSDLTDIARQRVDTWLASLRTLQAAPPEPDSLARADRWMARAEERVDHGDDVPALVDYLVASAALHGVLAAHPDPDTASRAYLQLAKIESRVGLTAWISQAESLFEASIRSDPGSASAAEAFALLRDFVVSGYTGSAGENVPSEWHQRLEELEQLAQPAAASTP